jgi:hypothetical protein
VVDSSNGSFEKTACQYIEVVAVEAYRSFVIEGIVAYQSSVLEAIEGSLAVVAVGKDFQNQFVDHTFVVERQWDQKRRSLSCPYSEAIVVVVVVVDCMGLLKRQKLDFVGILGI